MEWDIMQFPILRFVLPAAAAALFCSNVFAGPVKLVGVEVKTALPEEADDIVFGQHPKNGTEAKATFLILPDEGESIVEIREKDCEVGEIVDKESGQPVKLKVEFGSFPRVAKDGSVAAHSLEYPLPEDPGSGRIKVGGVVNVLVSKGVKTEKTGETTLVEAGKLKAGDLNLEITDLKTEDGKMNFGLKSSKPMTAIKEIRFMKPDGTAIESRRHGSSKMRMLGTFTETWNFALDAGDTAVKIEFDFYQNPTEKEIPFDFVLPSSM